MWLVMITYIKFSEFVFSYQKLIDDVYFNKKKVLLVLYFIPLFIKVGYLSVRIDPSDGIRSALFWIILGPKVLIFNN